MYRPTLTSFDRYTVIVPCILFFQKIYIKLSRISTKTLFFNRLATHIILVGCLAILSTIVLKGGLNGARAPWLMSRQLFRHRDELGGFRWAPDQARRMDWYFFFYFFSFFRSYLFFFLLKCYHLRKWIPNLSKQPHSLEDVEEELALANYKLTTLPYFLFIFLLLLSFLEINW